LAPPKTFHFTKSTKRLHFGDAKQGQIYFHLHNNLNQLLN